MGLKVALSRAVFLTLFCGVTQGSWSVGKGRNPYKKYAAAYDGYMESAKELEK